MPRIKQQLRSELTAEAIIARAAAPATNTQKNLLPGRREERNPLFGLIVAPKVRAFGQFRVVNRNAISRTE
jgi:hypothetical protein